MNFFSEYPKQITGEGGGSQNSNFNHNKNSLALTQLPETILNCKIIREKIVKVL